MSTNRYSIKSPRGKGRKESRKSSIPIKVIKIPKSRHESGTIEYTVKYSIVVKTIGHPGEGKELAPLGKPRKIKTVIPTRKPKPLGTTTTSCWENNK